MRRKKRIIVMNFHLQSKFLVYRIVAKYMVHVSVSSQQVLRNEFVLPNLIHDGSSLLGIIRSAINNHTLIGAITDHIAILLEHIANKFLRIQHIIFI
jgi:hypothetical protein